MTRRRGLELQAAWARYIRPWWPRAESTPNGIGGTDVRNTGIFWEVKTIRNSADGTNRFEPKKWVESALKRAAPGQLVIGVFWPERVGEKSPDKAIALVPAPTLLHLLERAGYTDEQPTGPAYLASLKTKPGKHPEGLPF